MAINSYTEAIDLLEKYPFFTYAALRATQLNPSDAGETAVGSPVEDGSGISRGYDKERLHLIIDLQISGSRFAQQSGNADMEGGTPTSLHDEDSSSGSQDAIDAFLSNFSPSPLSYTPAADEVTSAPDCTPPTEESARILIKNRKYSDALAIIEHLYLINPEKSIYFADQIRFLKKLILNQAKANK